jgi:hypothetical protein
MDLQIHLARLHSTLRWIWSKNCILANSFKRECVACMLPILPLCVQSAEKQFSLASLLTRVVMLEPIADSAQTGVRLECIGQKSYRHKLESNSNSLNRYEDWMLLRSSSWSWTLEEHSAATFYRPRPVREPLFIVCLPGYPVWLCMQSDQTINFIFYIKFSLI